MKVNGSPNKYPHRKLIMHSGDISLPRKSKIQVAKHSTNILTRPDKFTAFKEECIKRVIKMNYQALPTLLKNIIGIVLMLKEGSEHLKVDLTDTELNLTYDPKR